MTDHDSFDPSGPRLAEVPARPFTALQWLGTVFIVLGILFLLIQAADWFGLIGSRFKDSLGSASVLILSGTVLLNSRKWPPVDQRTTNRGRLILLALMAAMLIFGAVLVILIFKGA
jgi:hypothetical protein